jgi:hypothetical protein
MSTPVINSAISAARFALEGVKEDVVIALRPFLNNQNGLGNSRSILYAREACQKGYRKVCTAAAVRVAEIEGEGAIDLADALDAALHVLTDEALEVFPAYNWKRYRGFGAHVAKAEAELKEAWTRERESAIADLRVGIAGGVNVRKQHSIHIDNRGGAAQVAVGSKGVTQNMTAGIGIDARALKDLLHAVRQEVAKASLPEDQRDEIEDAIVATEREIEQKSPDEGRIKRLTIGVLKKVGEVGLPTAQKVLEHYLKGTGWIS